MKCTSVLLASLLLLGTGCVKSPIVPSNDTAPSPPSMSSYHGDILKDTLENENFRRVMFTGPNSQLVVMSIPPGGEIGEEAHRYTEQSLFFASGTGEALLDGKTFPVASGIAVVVTPGTRHNFKNTGTEPLRPMSRWSATPAAPSIAPPVTPTTTIGSM